MVKATEDLKIKVLEIKGPLEEYGDKIEDFADRLVR